MTDYDAGENNEAVGKCTVPMWLMGTPAGFCGAPAYGEQYPNGCDLNLRSMFGDLPYCTDLACPAHGGPKADGIRVYEDGYTKEGKIMWCATFHDFINLQESPAGFSGNPNIAVNNLRKDAQQ